MFRPDSVVQYYVDNALIMYNNLSYTNGCIIFFVFAVIVVFLFVCIAGIVVRVD